MVFQLIMVSKHHSIEVLYLAKKYQLHMKAYNLYPHIFRRNMSPLLPDSLPLRVYFLFFLFFFPCRLLYFIFWHIQKMTQIFK